MIVIVENLVASSADVVVALADSKTFGGAVAAGLELELELGHGLGSGPDQPSTVATVASDVAVVGMARTSLKAVEAGVG